MTLGVEETLEKLKRNSYWINIKTSIRNYLNLDVNSVIVIKFRCEIHQRSKYSRNPSLCNPSFKLKYHQNLFELLYFISIL